MNRREDFSYGLASAKIFEIEENVFVVANLISQSQGKGHATNVMKQIVAYADKNQVILSLKVQQSAVPRFGLSNKKLKEFYEKFGFIMNERDKKTRIMIRRPSQELQGL